MEELSALITQMTVDDLSSFVKWLKMTDGEQVLIEKLEERITILNHRFFPSDT